MIEIDQIQKNSSKKKVYAENYTGRKIHPIFIYFLTIYPGFLMKLQD
jgi:hypothetical protein